MKILVSVSTACIQSDRIVCRLLLVTSPDDFDPNPYLREFRTLCRNSKEYQGHGWGLSLLGQNSRFLMHHSIEPIWGDTDSGGSAAFPATRLLMVHARSAFRDEGIVVENNMPFGDDNSVFIFNGELRGVKIKAEGRIGAEKIYRYVQRFDDGENGSLGRAVRKAVPIIDRRTRYIRAMNFFVATPDSIEICSWFNEDPDYFQLHQSQQDNTRMICSGQLATLGDNWDTIANHTISSIPLQ